MNKVRIYIIQYETRTAVDTTFTFRVNNIIGVYVRVCVLVETGIYGKCIVQTRAYTYMCLPTYTYSTLTARDLSKTVKHTLVKRT